MKNRHTCVRSERCLRVRLQAPPPPPLPPPPLVTLRGLGRVVEGRQRAKKRLDSPGAPRRPPRFPLNRCELRFGTGQRPRRSKPVNLIPISGQANHAPSSVWLAPGKGNKETEKRSVCAKARKKGTGGIKRRLFGEAIWRREELSRVLVQAEKKYQLAFICRSRRVTYV